MAAARRKPAEKETPDVPEAEVAEAPQDGVFIAVQRNPDGGVATGIQVIGDVKITEVQTILELGLKAFRADAGLA